MAEGQAVRLEVRRVIRADREAVFDAWVDEDVIRQWWSPENYDPGPVTTDVREGGSFELGLQPPEGDGFSATGTYRTVDRPARLEFTWTWSNAPLETVVTVEFNEVEGGTEVVLTHTGFPNAEARDQHREGWEACLERMASLRV